MRSPWPVLVGCALVVVAFGLLPGGGTWSSSGWPHEVLVLPTEPYVLLPALALLAAWCLYESRPWDAMFVVLAPALALAANTWVLKPLFDRWKNDTLVYPSGHTVSLVATLVVVFVLVHGRARAITAAVGAALLASATIGMVGLGYHYVTDIVGGTFFAVFAVLALRRATTRARGVP